MLAMRCVGSANPYPAAARIGRRLQMTASPEHSKGSGLPMTAHEVLSHRYRGALGPCRLGSQNAFVRAPRGVSALAPSRAPQPFVSGPGLHECTV
jgi:hypothetical protein